MYQLVQPGSFEPENHFYPKVLNAQLHPMVRHFFSLSPERIINRYCHLFPSVDRVKLEEMLSYRCRYLRWAGVDLINVTPQEGRKQMVVIETNSCPSGQKSMPIGIDDTEEQAGYRKLVENVFGPTIARNKEAVPAVIYDKNTMESHGYACALADFLRKPVHLVTYYDDTPTSEVRFTEQGYLEVCNNEGQWITITHAIRYVTQRPWNRIPISCKTQFMNPIIGCLAGGRNKLIAAKAYELLNNELVGSGLKVRCPVTINDVTKMQIPLMIQSLGGFGVIKIPYSNAGQGVFTITSPGELEDFMAREDPYEQYIVQSLIGNSSWSSKSPDGQLYHVGTIPNKKNHIYVYDLRFMLGNRKDGFFPIAAYCRKARQPLAEHINATESRDSWAMLGTNLSIKEDGHNWGSDTKRLVLMDTKDFNGTGLSYDDLVDAYVQTLLAVVAIDKMAINLISKQGKLRRKLFTSLNRDQTLLDEILP